MSNSTIMMVTAHGSALTVNLVEHMMERYRVGSGAAEGALVFWCMVEKVTLLLDTRAMRYKTIITYPCVVQIHCNGDGTRLCVAMILAECMYKTVRCRVGFGRAESTLPLVVHPLI